MTGSLESDIILWLAACVTFCVSLLLELAVGDWCDKFELAEDDCGAKPQPILKENEDGSAKKYWKNHHHHDSSLCVLV